MSGAYDEPHGADNPVFWYDLCRSRPSPTSRYFRPAAVNYPLSLVRHIGMALTADQRNCIPERNCSRSGRTRRPHASGQGTPRTRQTRPGPAPSPARPPPRAAGQPAGPVIPAGKSHTPCRLSHLTQDLRCRTISTPGNTAPPSPGFNSICKFFSPEPGGDRRGRRAPGDATMPCGPRSL